MAVDSRPGAMGHWSLELPGLTQQRQNDVTAVDGGLDWSIPVDGHRYPSIPIEEEESSPPIFLVWNAGAGNANDELRMIPLTGALDHWGKRKEVNAKGAMGARGAIVLKGQPPSQGQP